MTVVERTNYWTGWGRVVVFTLAATSILCLLSDFYHAVSMRFAFFWVFLPAMVVLAVVTGADYVRGDGRLARGVVIGLVAGLVAACAYDVFRLPFVFAKPW